MDCVSLLSNAQGLTDAIVDRQLTKRDAAKKAGLCVDTLRVLIRRDTKISLKTAGKLRAAFGDAAIRILPAQMKEATE